MLEIGWIAGVDNIAYLEYMREQEEKVNVNENSVSWENKPPKAGVKE